MSCPLCGGRADAELGICGCGYNAREVAALQREAARWDRRRWFAAGGFGLGFACMLVPALSAGVLGVAGGLLMVGGALTWAWSRYYGGITERALREATTRKALPAARVL